MQIYPVHLFVKRLHPGLCRIEPGFGQVAKDLPEALKPTYLAQGQIEMHMFTSFLKKGYSILTEKQ